MEKQCRNCGKVKPLSEFYAHVKMMDGHLNKCKECVKARVKAHRDNNLEKVRAYDRARGNFPHRVAARASYAKTEAGKLSHAISAMKWQQNHADRKHASHIVRNALRDGRLKKPPCCFVPECGEMKVDAHHPDYSRPLDVVWLCRKHHSACHKLFNQMMRELVST